jgi:hypothetical protein
VGGAVAACPALEAGARKGKKESSFSEEKEAKRLFIHCAEADMLAGCEVMKVFWFFFSKKNRFLACPSPPAHDPVGFGE